MGKGKAKPRTRTENSAKAAAKREARRTAREAAGLPPKNMHKKSRPKLSTEGIKLEDLKIVTPADRAKEALSHVKWTALFKKHLGILEAHVKTLDRVVESLRAFMRSLPEDERKQWERGDVGNWGHICGLVDRARETLCGAKEASKGILTEQELRDKKGLGVKGTSYEKMYPAVLAAKEAWENSTQVLGAGTEEVEVDKDGDSEMEDAPSDDTSDSSSESDSEVDVAAPNQADNATTNGTTKVESNPYFVVDTNPTPVTTNIPPPANKSKKRSSDDAEDKPKATKKSKKDAAVIPHIATMAEALSSKVPLDEAVPEQTQDKKKRRKSTDEEGNKSKKAKKETTLIEAAAAVTEPTVDFAALQAKLQAEVDIGEATREVEASGSGADGEEKKNKKKKRRRSSDGLGGETEGKKVKKEEKDGKSRKRKA